MALEIAYQLHDEISMSPETNSEILTNLEVAKAAGFISEDSLRAVADDNSNPGTLIDELRRSVKEPTAAAKSHAFLEMAGDLSNGGVDKQQAQDILDLMEKYYTEIMLSGIRNKAVLHLTNALPHRDGDEPAKILGFINRLLTEGIDIQTKQKIVKNLEDSVLNDGIYDRPMPQLQRKAVEDLKQKLDDEIRQE